MIWVPVAVSLIAPLGVLALAWWLIRTTIYGFQDAVLEALQVEIRKQDDRIRKGKAAEPPRKPPDDGRLPGFDDPGALVLYPGQPVN